MMFKRILVPLDGSALSERALAPALKIGELEGSRVTLVRAPVVDLMLVPTVELYGNYSLRGMEHAVERARREAHEYLSAMQKAHARPNLELETVVAEGDPAGAILSTATARKSDLIVMSTHGYSGVTRWIMGSVTERVLSGAPCPVLVIRSENMPKRMLIPLDGSDLSEKALEPALEVATAFDAQVTLLQCVKRIPSWHMEELESVEHGLGLRASDEMMEQARAYLQGVAEKYSTANRPIQVVVRYEPAATAILEYAEANSIDMVAMATHGRTGMQKWLYGSVTEKVLRNSHGFAMLVVRPASQ
ncbi:MAG: universal stress protein [Anaerolineales bacterium]|nr:universal stress protein [Anaerolineales bacterium]